MRSLLTLAAGAVVVAACSSETGGGGAQGGSTTDGTGSGAATGTGSAATGGAGQPCTDVADCPADTDCITHACAMDECVATIAPEGTPIVNGEVFGDCRRRVCGPAGEPTEIDDDGDLPNDFNPCTDDGCRGGMPTSAPVADQTPCGSSDQLACVSGLCTGCNNDSACPPGDTCHAPECVNGPNGTCSLTVAEGKEVSNAVPDDCLHAVCDGAGKIVVTADASEVPPPDANTCDVESCSASGLVAHTSVEDGASCDGATSCDPKSCTAGACIQAPEPPADTPSATQTAGDCQVVLCDGRGGEFSAAQDSDAPPDPSGSDCTLPTCAGGVPGTGNQPQGTPCVGGVDNVCDENGNCT